MTELLWMGEAYVKTVGSLGATWVLRHLSLSPHHLEWHADESRREIVGTVQLGGSSLLLADPEETPSLSGNTVGLCVELDWSGKDFLPMFLASADESHDAVLVSYSSLFLPHFSFTPRSFHAPSGLFSLALRSTNDLKKSPKRHNLCRLSLRVQPPCRKTCWRRQACTLRT